MYNCTCVSKIIFLHVEYTQCTLQSPHVLVTPTTHIVIELGRDSLLSVELLLNVPQTQLLQTKILLQLRHLQEAS